MNHRTYSYPPDLLKDRVILVTGASGGIGRALAVHAAAHGARVIIHGRNDVVGPIEHSRSYAANYPDQTELVEVDSDHRLNDQLDLIWKYGQSFLLG